MAKSGKKKRRIEDEPIEETFEVGSHVVPRKRVELLGIVLFVIALLLCFSLFSFEPGEMAAEENLIGPLGAKLAKFFLGGIGVVGYVMALGLAFFAGAVIIGRLARPGVSRCLAAIGIIVAASVLAQLVSRGALVAGYPAGGAVGEMLGRALTTFSGSVGAALLSVGAILLGVTVVFDVSIGNALRETLDALGEAKGRAAGWLEAERAAREAASQRETEVVEAERSRRVQSKLEQEEREHRLRESIEEKKRLAILKATSKAEERALAKIARLDVEERIERERAEQEALDEEQSDLDEEESDEASEQEQDGASDEGDEYEDDDENAELEDGGDEEEDALEEEPSTPPARATPRKGASRRAPIIVAQPSADNAADVIDELERRASLLPLAADELNSDDEVHADLPMADDLDPGAIKVYERKHVDTAEVLEAADELEPAVAAPKLEKRVFQMPGASLLDYEGTPPLPVDGEALRTRATRLEEKLKTYGVEGRVTAIRPGPVVTTYEYQPAPGVKVAKIANLSDDIAMSMEAMRVRIVAPIPGRGVVGIELPNETREPVYLKEIIAHDGFKRSKSLLTLALGKDAEGEPQVRDLRSMPHILVAGTTGSGKSVSINTMILSILYKATPDQVKFIMVDPKMLELSLYEDIPHLLLPVVTDPRKASLALQWAVDEMERRYQLLSEFKVRDLDGFNRKLERLREQRGLDAKRRLPLPELPEGAVETDDVLWSPEGASEFESQPPKDEKRALDPWPGKDLPETIPYIVVLIDEFADLMCVAPRDVEASVQRLAQKARAAGIHVMLATQRPSTDVITGVIKNNFPSRISFRVASRHDSATILNAPGAENLLGMGDMLCLGLSSPAPVRIHGAYVSEEEVQRVVDFWKAQAKPNYDATILRKRDDEDGEGGEPLEHDEMYDKAVAIVAETRKASISAIQRRLRVGYNRAARMIEMMETEGIVGPATGPKGEREVFAQAITPN